MAIYLPPSSAWRKTPLVANASARQDPTRTIQIRNAFVNDFRKRFAKIIRLIRETIVTNDALNLTNAATSAVRRGPRPNAPNRGNRALNRYDFPSDVAGKADAFMRWIKEVEAAQLFEVYDEGGPVPENAPPWQQLHLRSAYSKALSDANGRLHTIGTPSGLSSAEAIRIGLNMPIHAAAINIIFSRNYHLLRDITTTMDKDIALVLADGLARGLGPRQIAKLLADKVGITLRRAERIARTEVIHAYTEATLNAYQTAGVTEVTPLVEFATAGDERVCSRCRAIDREGKTYTIQQARGIIPVHPNCRCVWLPVPIQRRLNANTLRTLVNRG